MQKQTHIKVNINDSLVSLSLASIIPAFISLFLSAAVGMLFLVLSLFNNDLLNVAGVAFLITFANIIHIITIPRFATKRAARLIAAGHGTITQ